MSQEGKKNEPKRLTDELFSQNVIDHLRALGAVVTDQGGYGAITIEIFRDQVVGCSTYIETKQGYQF